MIKVFCDIQEYVLSGTLIYWGQIAASHMPGIMLLETCPNLNVGINGRVSSVAF